MLKVLKYIVALVFVGGSFYYLYTLTLSPCDKPFVYSIGRFDTQFGESKSDFLARLKAGESVWEKALGKNIFEYKEGANFKINLIFDERQQSTNDKQKTEFGLSAVEDLFKKLDAQFNASKIDYDNKKYIYEQAVLSYEANKKAYEERVAYWNSHKGAPDKEYNELQKEAEALNDEAQRINQMASSLNTTTKELNDLLAIRNTAAENYNKIANEYNKKYGAGLEFDQAEYVGKEINVYQFGNKNDLTLALAHEFGHALGMDHVENSKSIMYYLTGDNISNSPTPTSEDLAELKRVCSGSLFNIKSLVSDWKRRLGL